MRRRNIKNAPERIKQAEGLFILNPNDYKGKWNTLFNNDNPIHVEIGMGKGKFIIAKALENLNINYIGIEKFDSVVCQAITKIGDQVIPNLHLICMDASMLFNVFEKDEVKKLYLNFSDPWPKARHEKRRLTSKTYLVKYEEFLDGDIEFKTDNHDLFFYSVESFKNNNYKILDYSEDLHSYKNNIITTEYEDRFSAMGNPIYYINVVKEK